MTITVHPINAVTGAPSYSGKMHRQVLSFGLEGATATRQLGARTGVRKGTPATTVAATSTTWTVTPFSGVIDLETSAVAGAYWFASDANVTGSVTAANATNPRVDIITVKIDDPAESDGSSVPAVTINYTAGTAAASPVAPATPARSFVIANINVPVSGGGSPTVVWNAPYSVAAGGIIPVRSQAERDAITFGTSENPVYVDRLDLGIMERSVASGTWAGASIGPWVSYSPTLSGFALGSGGVASTLWRREGDQIHVRAAFQFGSSGQTFPTVPGITLPVTGQAPPHAFAILGSGSYFDTSATAIYPCHVVAAASSATTVQFYHQVPTGAGSASQVVTAGTSTTTPFTWATGDVISTDFTYRTP